MASYVEIREEEIKAKYHVEMWWIGITKLWSRLGHLMKIKRDADVLMDEFNGIRSKYIKRGRKAVVTV